MAYTTDAVVIGAGLIGLAVARALAQAGMETIVLERASAIGTETSSRNSEVIHAGIYYPAGSLKARSCVRGKALLYDFVRAHNVPYSRCGKLVLAVSEADRKALLALRDQATRCGVDDLLLLDAAAVHELEPRVRAAAGLLSPSTGIVDSHQLLLALQGDLEAAGGSVVLATPLVSGRLSAGGGRHVLQAGGAVPAEIRCRVVVNAAGLLARDTWLSLVDAARAPLAPRQYYAVGHYYSYPGMAPFSRLVYPLPESGGLGVHATLDLAGQVRFGPDVRWIETPDYVFDDGARDDFAASIRRYFPGLRAERLQPAYTGVRPKISGPGEPAADFCVLAPRQHGIPGFCSLHGIESPGLTACLAIAEHVLELLA